uniref:WD_REPEATS_REGION domain-containing protein n=1 Tax=Haemonchus contortus TaxID=6289 RepID=A0A7I4YT87_HAECO
MDLVQAANPIRNYKRKQRHFEFYRSVPCAASYYHGSESYNWVVCRFSPHSETVLYLGGDEGDVGIVDITPVVGSEPNHEAVQIQSFPAHNATVMDVIGVPNNPNQLLSISGDTTARLWDLQRHDSVLFFGHEMSVRSACFAPQSSQVFATGGRDGQIRLWDVRTSSLQQQGQFLKKAVNVYMNAHLMKDHRSPSRRRSVSRLSTRFEKVEPPSVTSLLYANDYTLVSASSCGKSGLRLWDTRKISAKDEGHVLSKLEVPTHKEAGITSICLDRFGSSLFAAVTDNCVYEYGILTSNTKPLRHLTGAAIESFYVQLQCSPSADYLLCGSKNQQAVIWDLQDLYSSFDEQAISSERQCRALLPKYTLKGHDSEVCCAGWSRNGRYMVSMDDSHFRVWSADMVNPGKSEANSNIETISTYELNESEKTTLLVTRMSIRRGQGPSGSPTSFASTPSRKRKEPFESPIKRLRTPTKSPISKMMKLVSPVLPFANITNAEAGSADIASTTTPQSHRRSRKKGAFHYKYPTENLPNKVYERYIAKFKARRLTERQSTPSACVESESPSTSKRNIDDYYLRSCLDQTRSLTKTGRSRLPSVTEFGDSVCSKMVSEQHRTLQNSPRKLTVKLTPLKSRPLTQVKEQKDSQKRSSRNLLDYFPKKVPPVEPSSSQDATTPVKHG